MICICIGVQAAFIETSCFMAGNAFFVHPCTGAAFKHPVRSIEAPAIKKHSILAPPGILPGGIFENCTYVILLPLSYGERGQGGEVKNYSRILLGVCG
jgi:hypothetical protein